MRIDPPILHGVSQGTAGVGPSPHVDTSGFPWLRMFCAGENGNHFPAGLSGGSSADNFAKPLFATGFFESVTPYAGDGVNGPGMLITFDFDNPASKVAPHPTLDTFFVGKSMASHVRAGHLLVFASSRLVSLRANGLAQPDAVSESVIGIKHERRDVRPVSESRASDSRSAPSAVQGEYGRLIGRLGRLG